MFGWVCTTVDGVAGFLHDVTPGSWPDWIAAIGTTAAFLIAAVSYRRSVRDAEQSQARLVYSDVTDVTYLKPGDNIRNAMKDQNGLWVSGFAIVNAQDPYSGGIVHETRATDHVVLITVTIRNGSDELIGPVKIRLFHTGEYRHLEDCDLLVSDVQPKKKVRRTIVFVNEVHPAMAPHGAEIVFRDSSSRWWRRTRFEPVERIHWDPANERHSDFLKRSADQNVIAAGGTPVPLPPDPARIRFRRWWRTVRGLPAVP
jgi:hypothetical protein